METEVINGRTLVVRHTFPLEELQVGSQWAPADGGDREVEITEIDREHGGWIKYRDKIDGIIREKDWFSFQVRYCLIVKIGANVIDSSKIPLFLQFETSQKALDWILTLPAGTRMDYEPAEMDNGKWTIRQISFTRK